MIVKGLAWGDRILEYGLLCEWEGLSPGGMYILLLFILIVLIIFPPLTKFIFWGGEVNLFSNLAGEFETLFMEWK